MNRILSKRISALEARRGGRPLWFEIGPEEVATADGRRARHSDLGPDDVVLSRVIVEPGPDGPVEAEPCYFDLRALRGKPMEPRR